MVNNTSVLGAKNTDKKQHETVSVLKELAAQWGRQTEELTMTAQGTKCPRRVRTQGRGPHVSPRAWGSFQEK